MQYGNYVFCPFPVPNRILHIRTKIIAMPIQLHRKGDLNSSQPYSITECSRRVLLLMQFCIANSSTI